MIFEADLNHSRFEKMHPAPAWATEARRKVLRKRSKAAKSGAAVAEDGESDEGMSGDEDEVDDLFRSAGGKKKATRRGLLQQGEIEIDRVRDANQAEATSVGIWHFPYILSALLTLSHSTERRCVDWLPPSSPSSLLRYRRPTIATLPGALPRFSPSQLPLICVFTDRRNREPLTSNPTRP